MDYLSEREKKRKPVSLLDFCYWTTGLLGCPLACPAARGRPPQCPGTHPSRSTLPAEYLDGILGPLNLADSNSNAILGHGLSFLVGRASYTFGLQVGAARDSRLLPAKPHCLQGRPSATLPAMSCCNAAVRRLDPRALPSTRAGPLRQHRHRLLLLPGGAACGACWGAGRRVRRRSDGRRSGQPDSAGEPASGTCAGVASLPFGDAPVKLGLLKMAILMSALRIP